MKILSGNNEIELKTPTEILLAAALKAVILAKGEQPSTGGVIREFKVERFAFKDAMSHHIGTLQVGTDGNNGRDFVRVKR